MIRLFQSYINFIILNLQSSSWFGKIVFGAFCYLLPLQVPVLIFLSLIVLDILLAIISYCKTCPLFSFRYLWEFIIMDRILKFTSYLFVMIGVYIFQTHFLKGVIDLQNIIMSIIGIGEISLMLESSAKITKNNMFIRLRDKLTGWLNKKIDNV